MLIVGFDRSAVSPGTQARNRFHQGEFKHDRCRKSLDEMVDLFARGTDAEAILAFRPSAQAQRRVRYLLGRGKSGEITPEEAAELQRLGEIEHLMQLVKARARQYLDRR